MEDVAATRIVTAGCRACAYLTPTTDHSSPIRTGRRATTRFPRQFPRAVATSNGVAMVMRAVTANESVISYIDSLPPALASSILRGGPSHLFVYNSRYEIQTAKLRYGWRAPRRASA
jgi:hypothetical protein